MLNLTVSVPSSSDRRRFAEPAASIAEYPADTTCSADSVTRFCGSLKLKYHLLSPPFSAASRSSASVRFRSSAANASSTACASVRDVDAGVELYEPFDIRCLFDGGPVGVLGVEDADFAALCMNFIVSVPEDNVFGCLFGCAISATEIEVYKQRLRRVASEGVQGQSRSQRSKQKRSTLEAAVRKDSAYARVY